MKIFCKWFGHKYDDVELTVFGIQCDALNSTQLEARISCLRCGREVIKPRGL